MYKYSNQLLPDVFNNLFLNLLMFMNTIPETHPHNMCVCMFPTNNSGTKKLSYCSARIWNYILDNVDSKCAIGSFKKRIQRLFLFSNDDLIT